MHQLVGGVFLGMCVAFVLMEAMRPSGSALMIHIPDLPPAVTSTPRPLNITIVNYLIYWEGNYQAVRVPFVYASDGLSVMVSWKPFTVLIETPAARAIGVRVDPAPPVCAPTCAPNIESYGMDLCSTESEYMMGEISQPYTMHIPSDRGELITAFTVGFNIGSAAFAGGTIVYAC